MNGYLLLENGEFFSGRLIGADVATPGEAVFHTGMTGYQEILTDPSYKGQIVVMTYPHIGNYGVNTEDVESRKVFLSGFVMRDYSEHPSNWRSTSSLQNYLKEQGVAAIDRIDTRKITRLLRSKGAMKAVIASDRFSLEKMKQMMAEAPNMEGANLVSEVVCDKPFSWTDKVYDVSLTSSSPRNVHVVVVDCGIKYQTLRYLAYLGAKVTVVPYHISSSEIMKLKPNGILISNGPGDPAAVPSLPDTIRALIGKVPMLGICLGHQLLGLAVGAKTYKLKFGHHGANHPVLNKDTGRIEITSQNHGFAIDGHSLDRAASKHFGKVELTHTHLSDGTVEGFRLAEVGVTAIQYHPEASPGPHDSNYLFTEFVQCLKS